MGDYIPVTMSDCTAAIQAAKRCLINRFPRQASPDGREVDLSASDVSHLDEFQSAPAEANTAARSARLLAWGDLVLLQHDGCAKKRHYGAYRKHDGLWVCPTERDKRIGWPWPRGANLTYKNTDGAETLRLAIPPQVFFRRQVSGANCLLAVGTVSGTAPHHELVVVAKTQGRPMFFPAWDVRFVPIDGAIFFDRFTFRPEQHEQETVASLRKCLTKILTESDDVPVGEGLLAAGQFVSYCDDSGTVTWWVVISSNWFNQQRLPNGTSSNIYHHAAILAYCNGAPSPTAANVSAAHVVGVRLVRELIVEKRLKPHSRDHSLVANRLCDVRQTVLSTYGLVQ